VKTRDLREWAVDKPRFGSVDDYIAFGRAFLDFRAGGNFQAELIARNDHKYQFLQYRDDAGYQLTRPINAELMYSANAFDDAVALFRDALDSILNGSETTTAGREALNRVIYTCQQSIGAALDALPARQSNTARKVNGDLFERFIGLLILDCGVDCKSGVISVPVKDEVGTTLFGMNYQHDLMVEVNGDLKAIGSVKTSSKDRLDKVFIDKFLYGRLTGTDLPHFAIFLHDVQRAGKEPNYGVSRTFLPGHFKGYTVKLNPLDGVYYCDLLPNMKTDALLARHISRIDNFFVEDLPAFVAAPAAVAEVVQEDDIVEATED
jgi:hypothetical protein